MDDADADDRVVVGGLWFQSSLACGSETIRLLSEKLNQGELFHYFIGTNNFLLNKCEYYFALDVILHVLFFSSLKCGDLFRLLTSRWKTLLTPRLQTCPTFSPSCLVEVLSNDVQITLYICTLTFKTGFSSSAIGLTCTFASDGS